MGRIPAEHERGARRRTRRVARIITREPDAVGGELVEVGRLEFRLAVTAQVAVTQAVALNEDDARPARRGRMGVGEWKRIARARRQKTKGRGGEQNDSKDDGSTFVSLQTWILENLMRSMQFFSADGLFD